MLYGLSPSAKRKYSNLKQLVGRQIVKRNKKKTNSIAVVTSGRRTTATQGDFKRGLSIGHSDLEGQHTYWESNRDVQAHTPPKGLAKGWGHSSHTRVVSAYFPPWKQLCRHAQNTGWVRCAAVEGVYSWETDKLGKSLKRSNATGYSFAPIRSTKSWQRKAFKLFSHIWNWHNLFLTREALWR